MYCDRARRREVAVDKVGETMTLPWPREAALSRHGDRAELSVPASNMVLDLHGDPLAAKLVVYSDGNHHMALADTVAAFAASTPEIGDIFYATTPPRIISQALTGGAIATGNVSLSVTPHVFISPGDVLEGLRKKGLVGDHHPVMRSTGLAILVANGNPKNVRAPTDLLAGNIRLAISNPVSEKASYAIYEAALCAFASLEGHAEAGVREYLTSPRVAKSRIIHHREIPQILASGGADASLIYYHLALRYTRIFPDLFDLVEVDIASLPAPQRFTTTYHIAVVGEGGSFGARFAQFFQSEQVADIYTRHGLQPVGAA